MEGAQQQSPVHSQLEHYLASRRGAFDGARMLADDEAERFPQEDCDALEDWGLHRYYVPSEWGGEWSATEDMIRILRAVARRDLSVAIGHAKTFLGSAPVWVAGNAEQKMRLARIVLERRAVSLGLTERAHGSDLAASQVLARRTPRGFELSGEKWLINNATRGAALSVLARTGADAGPSSTSFFLVEKAKLPAHTFRPVPKVSTLGIRGADISGIVFERAPVLAEDCVGGVGAGLDVALKTLQVTRTLCAGLSLGAGDSALRMSLGFARRRQLYGRTVFDMDAARAKLAACYADLLLCECASIAGARLLHTAPEQMSLVSAVVKYFVPTQVDVIVDSAAVVLGARHYVRGEFCSGLFQKLERDHRLVALFDGSTMVNLAAIAVQLERLARSAGSMDQARSERLARTLALGQATPPVALERLALLAPNGNDVVDGFLVAAREARPSALGAVVERMRVALEALFEEVRALWKASAGAHRSATAFELARRYAALHAGASCFLLWHHGRDAMAAEFRDDTWLVVCLERALLHAGAMGGARSVEAPLALSDLLLRQGERSEAFSVFGGPAPGAPFEELAG
jgi:alkylation response protein AidB-like acyl-CoA dehydrogenase